MSLGRKVRGRRIELGMSQQELADAMGYSSRSTIARIESGDNDVPRSRIAKMASSLGVDVEYLLAEAGPAHDASGDDPLEQAKGARAKNIAVVLAGGASTRNQQDIPNQFINLLGKPMIIYVLEVYQRHPLIDEIYVVCLRGWEEMLEGYARRYGITKFAGVVPGGSSGVRSAMNAVALLKGTCSQDDIVVLQESTRPLVSEEMVSKLLLSCRERGNAVTCESMYDRIQFRVSDDAAEYVNRSELLCMQSPEAYRYGMLAEAFEKAQTFEFCALLEETYCGLMLHHLGYSLHFCEGDRNNIKAVHQEDVAVLTALLKQTGRS